MANAKLQNAINHFRQARDRQTRADTTEAWLLDQQAIQRAEEAIRELLGAGEIDAGDLPPELDHLCPHLPVPPISMSRAIAREIPAP